VVSYRGPPGSRVRSTVIFGERRGFSERASERVSSLALNPCLRDGTSSRGNEIIFLSTAKDDYSGFDETDFSTRTARGRWRGAAAAAASE